MYTPETQKIQEETEKARFLVGTAHCALDDEFVIILHVAYPHRAGR
jgi:hypothetical protein